MKLYLPLLIFFGVVSFSCGKDPVQPPPVTPPEDSVVVVVAKTMTDVSYGSDPLQKLDVYLPKDRSVSSTKSIVLIHGGSWESGDKSELTQFVDTLQKRLPSYAIFNINYRLSTNGVNIFPTQEMDVKASLQYIVDNAVKYLISKKIILLGVSAGGQLALLQGYKYNTPVIPEAIVSFYGPTDLTAMYDDPTDALIPPALAEIVGKTPSQDPAIYKNSSPINFVTATSPPTIFFQGGMDSLIKVSQATSLQSKLNSAGVVNQYIYYPEDGHGWLGPDLVDSFDKIQAFLSTNVK